MEFNNFLLAQPQICVDLIWKTQEQLARLKSYEILLAKNNKCQWN